MSDLKIFTDNIEPTALNQIYTLVKQPAFADCKVRIMPDVHAGAGCVIGFTADLGDKVIPNIVGVDIGCGMLTVELGKIDIDFDYLDKAIRENVPSGREVNETAIYPTEVIEYIRCYKALKDPERLVRSIGSLGGGNHFIEIDTDSEGVKYLVIHTGSRNLGKQVAEYYQNLAIETMQGKDEIRLFNHGVKVENASLLERLKARIEESAIKVSTVKAPHTYMKAVGTRELEKILEEELGNEDTKRHTC